jgi:hypothetical protein
MKPSGFDIMSTLIELLAEQEGLKITYELSDGKTTVQRTTGEKGARQWERAS